MPCRLSVISYLTRNQRGLNVNYNTVTLGSRKNVIRSIFLCKRNCVPGYCAHAVFVVFCCVLKKTDSESVM